MKIKILSLLLLTVLVIGCPSPTSKEPIIENTSEDDSSTLDDSKQIMSFILNYPDTIGIINEENLTISLELPYGYPIQALNPTIEYHGNVVTPMSGASNDFSNNTSYTVEAADGSSKTYNVSVSFAPITSIKSGLVNSVGYNDNIITQSLSFNMRYCPGGTFPTGIDDSGSQSVSPFWIGETELTEELLYIIYCWAIKGTGGAIGEGQYIFDYPRFPSEGGSLRPVDTLTWRNAMVLSNAITEWYNAGNNNFPDLELVYYTDVNYTIPIRTSTGDETDLNSDFILDNSLVKGTEDFPYIKSVSIGNTSMDNCTANGFRLLTSDEWDAAARYIDGINWNHGNHVSGDNSGPCYISGSSLCSHTSLSSTFYEYVKNSSSGTETKPVMSFKANALGVYDMTGNVSELCFDWSDSFIGISRINRGGSNSHGPETLQIGRVSSTQPNYATVSNGVRLARSIF